MSHGRNIAGHEVQAHRDDASHTRIFYPSPFHLQGHLSSWQGRKSTAHFGKMEKTFQFHRGWLGVLGMQAVRCGARLEHVPLAFSLSLLPSPSHSTQQTPPGAFGRSLISEHCPLICSLQPGLLHGVLAGDLQLLAAAPICCWQWELAGPCPSPCAAAQPGQGSLLLLEPAQHCRKPG